MLCTHCGAVLHGDVSPRPHSLVGTGGRGSCNGMLVTLSERRTSRLAKQRWTLYLLFGGQTWLAPGLPEALQELHLAYANDRNGQ